jgi:hypothetical protein
MVLDPEVKSKWVTALRDGSYKQGRGRLRRGDTFCCLGVFLDLFGGRMWADHPDDNGVYAYMTTEEGCEVQHRNLPPSRTCRIHGVSPQYMDQLSRLNDTHRWSFAKIADYIERSTHF